MNPGHSGDRQEPNRLKSNTVLLPIVGKVRYEPVKVHTAAQSGQIIGPHTTPLSMHRTDKISVLTSWQVFVPSSHTLLVYTLPAASETKLHQPAVRLVDEVCGKPPFISK